MSHFTVTVAVAPPESTIGCTIFTKEDMAEFVLLRKMLKNDPDNFSIKYRLKALVEKSSPFESEVEVAVKALLAPYCESTEDPEYIKFTNVEDECRSEYETDTTTAIHMPNGKICSAFDSEFTKFYELRDNKVYLRTSSPAELPALPASNSNPSDESNELKVLENYPVKLLYPVFTDYLENYRGYTYDEAHKAYGYYSNPNAQWDWYQVGGRWMDVFLVKDTCDLKIQGERGLLDGKVSNAPEGYLWVAGARKRDIQWEKMKELKLEAKEKQFFVLDNWFLHDVEPNPVPIATQKKEDGIHCWGSILYHKGETLEGFLKRKGLHPNVRYAHSSYAYLDEDGWQSQGDMGWFGISSNDKDEGSWNEMVQAFIDSVPDDYILVSVDCHI